MAWKRPTLNRIAKMAMQAAVGLLTPKSCTLCDNRIKSVSYPWRVKGELHILCPPCNSTLERQNSKAAVEALLNPEAERPSTNKDATNRHISASVKRMIWRRDQGRCVECGSKKRLEYDHIIPVAKGGSNTERNVQLLCETCNRKKSAKIM